MSRRTTPRRAVVAGAVLCGCLFGLLWAPPTAAVAPPDGKQGVAAATSGDTSGCGSGGARTAVADGTYTAVLDRIEGDLAVLEVSDDDGDTHELVVDVATLPPDGRHPNAVFEIRVTDGELQDPTYDESRSESRHEAAQDRFDRLTSEPQGEDDNEDGDGDVDEDDNEGGE